MSFRSVTFVSFFLHFYKRSPRRPSSLVVDGKSAEVWRFSPLRRPCSALRPDGHYVLPGNASKNMGDVSDVCFTITASRRKLWRVNVYRPHLTGNVLAPSFT